MMVASKTNSNGHKTWLQKTQKQTEAEYQLCKLYMVLFSGFLLWAYLNEFVCLCNTGMVRLALAERVSCEWDVIRSFTAYWTCTTIKATSTRWGDALVTAFSLPVVRLDSVLVWGCEYCSALSTALMDYGSLCSAPVFKRKYQSS